MRARQRTAISPGPLPISEERSKEPSPVMTKSAERKCSSSFACRAMRSKPGSSFAPANAHSPKPSPPAAPVPGAPARSRPSCVFTVFANRRSARSALGNSSGRRPFWGPYTREQPRAPRSLFCTSTATMSCGKSLRRRGATSRRNCCRCVQRNSSSSRPLKNCQPSPRASPAPPSFVALPPMPTKHRRAPCFAAACRTAARPSVSSWNG